jgi:outer membrane immunogenic protein
VKYGDTQMKRTLALSALLVAVAMPALAADLPVKAPPLAPLPVYNWTGFYVGINGGWSAGHSSRDLSFFNAVTGATIVPGAGSNLGGGTDLNGGVFGGQIGYNWQTANWVFGLETDAQWTGQRGSSTFLCAGLVCVPGLTALPAGVFGTAAQANQKLEWFGTFRGRGGFLVSPTGGLAYGTVKTDVLLATTTAAGVPIAVTGSGSSDRAGWTVGVGGEWAFGSNWTAKIEYLYMDIGTSTATAVLGPAGIAASLSSRTTDNIIRGGINYRF